MSEQIREQVSAFLDGELPNSETELLLKRLTRDGELRESFGRYALIGEAIRGGEPGLFDAGLRRPGESGHRRRADFGRWARGAGSRIPVVAAVRGGRGGGRCGRGGGRRLAPAGGCTAGCGRPWRSTRRAALQVQPAALAQNGAVPAAPREAISYTVPATSGAAPPVGLAPGRLTNYVFAHSQYSSGLAQRGVMADMLIESDQQQPAIEEAAAHVAP